MSKIKNIKSNRIINSRSFWTLRTRVFLENGTVGIGEVPSGISTGSKEATLLPTDEAIKKVNRIIAPRLKGINALDQRTADKKMLEIDGTENKEELGGNAVLSVSLAVCDAAAKSQKKPLYQHLRNLYNLKLESWDLPNPMLLMLEGGEHAKNDMDFQEFMITPQAKTFTEKIELGMKLYQKLLETLDTQSHITAVGSEGGFSPQNTNIHQAFSLIENTIEEVAEKQNVGITLDIAANAFCSGNLYNLEGLGQQYNADRLLTFYKDLVSHHDLLVSLEDPFSENHTEYWTKITTELAERVEIIGDDLLTTNKTSLKEALEKSCVTGVIVKPNQIGTLTETLDFTEKAKKNNLTVIVSHRSGETNSSFISDLAAAVNADYIKAGALARGERVAKYNRLLEIERELNRT